MCLTDALSKFGWRQDDLQYPHFELEAWKGPKPPNLTEYLRCLNNIPIVGLFSGCGGRDLGCEAAGYDHVALFEHNEIFCQTLRLNRPHRNVIGPPHSTGDVSDISYVTDRLSQIIASPFEGVIIGGPPCQSFSFAANQRFSKSSPNFKRMRFSHEENGSPLYRFAAIVIHFRPVCFLIENVIGPRDLDSGQRLHRTIDEMEECGFYVQTPLVLNAADYGVPQSRERLFVIGTKIRLDSIRPVVHKRRYGAGSVLSRVQGTAKSTETRPHRLESVLRCVQLQNGRRNTLGRVDRMSPALPSETGIAGGSNGGGRSHLHPEIPRILSVRECARLQ